MLQMRALFVILVIFVIAAKRRHVSLIRGRKRDCQEILKGFRADRVRRRKPQDPTGQGENRGQGLFQFQVRSRLNCALRLAAMYQNIGVLLEAICLIEKEYFTAPRGSAEFEGIKGSMRRARWSFLQLALRELVRPGFRQEGRSVSAATEMYISLIVCLGRQLLCCHPRLFLAYRYCVSWQQYGADSESTSLGDYPAGKQLPELIPRMESESTISEQGKGAKRGAFCALAYGRNSWRSGESTEAPVVLLVCRDPDGMLRLLVHPELRSMFTGIDLDYLASLVLDFISLSKTDPDALFEQVSSLSGLGPLFIHADGNDISEFPSLVKMRSCFIEL
jgi:hypothetical protein